MEGDRLLCIDKICRTCLSESPNLKSLHSEMEDVKCTLLDALRCLTNNAVLMLNEFPDRICGDCEQSICKAEAFKRRCKQSEMYLEDYLKNDLHHSSGKQTKRTKVKQEKTDSEVTYVPFLCSYCCNKYATLTALVSHRRFCQRKKRKSVKKLKHLNQGIKVINTSGVSLEEKPLDIKTEDSQDMDCDDDSNFNQNSDVLNIEYKPMNMENTQATECGSIKTESSECHTESCSEEIKLIHNEVQSASEKVDNLVLNSKTNKLNSVDKCENIRKRFKKPISDSEKYQCSLCMRKFIKKSSLAMHIKKHEDGDITKKHICNTCKREFKHQAHLDNHILNVHTRDKGFTCDTCSKCFSTQGSLDTHKELHKVTKRHQCTMCEKSFVMLSTLTDHMRTHTGERPFLCSTCGRGFSQKTNLAQHMRRHLGLKPFKCETCGRGFVSKGELEAHTRKHSGAHPFLCDDCGSGFTTSSSLVKHRRTHTGERPYACDLCTMRFAVSGTLKNHRRTHTNERPYQCSHCDKAFVQKNDLVSHTRCHTGERPYVCTVCGQAFRKTSGLKTHLRNCHKDGRDGMMNGVSGMLGMQ